MTDKPAPITVKLAQKSDADNLSSLLGENITRGALKNLVTDKPAPITQKLAQLKSLQWIVSKTLPDFEPLNKTITVGYDRVTGMAGNETVYGDAIVGGDDVTYKTVKSR